MSKLSKSTDRIGILKIAQEKKSDQVSYQDEVGKYLS